MNIPLMCSLNISPESWIQLISGFGAVVVALLAIIHGNKNSRKALGQQNRILEYQHNEKKLDEYRKCLSDNMELLNVVDAFSPLVAVSHSDYSRTKQDIISRKAKISTYDLRFRYLFGADCNTVLYDKYCNSWDLATTQLSSVSDVMLSYVNYLSEFSSKIEILKNIRQQISVYEQMKLTDIDNASFYQLEIVKLQNEQKEVTVFISKNKEIVDEYIAVITNQLNDMRAYTSNLHNLSMKIIHEKERQVKALLEK